MAIVLALMLVGVVVVGARGLVREPLRRRRYGLMALRLVTAMLAWCVAAQPTWIGERLQYSEGRLAVLVDASRSMGVADDEEPRAAQASALLARWARGGTATPAEVSRFGGELRPSSLEELAAGYDPGEDQSRITGSVADLVEGDERGDLGAVVVVSDGADRSEQGQLESLAHSGVKVHAIAVGAEEPLRDDTIVSVQADAVAFLRQPGRVRVVVRSVGGAGVPVPVSLRSGERLVREVLAEPDADGLAVVEIPFTPNRLGRSVFELSIPVAPGDVVPENNERAFLVRVTRDKLRVLLVAGRPSWDERYLRDFFKRDPAIDLVSFFILRTASDLTMASPDELALIPFPTDELFSEHLGSFDLVVLQNFEYGPYQMAAYLSRIRDYVLRGGGLAMVGGDLAFASGGYAETPLADVLPVTMPPSTTPETRAIVTGRFRPRLSPDMARHPLLELLPGPAANSRAWASLAMLEGANALTGLRGDGRALLLHPDRRAADGTPMPLLAVGTAGRGRALALATDTTWRWGISTAGLTGDASAYERFWDRALRWLTGDPSLDPARVTTDRERYGVGARVRITALLRDERYEPLADRVVRLSILDSAGAEVAGDDVRVDGAGNARAELPGPDRPGGYRVVARALDAPEPLCEEGFVVERGGDELADPQAHPDVLRALAAATGGSFHALADAPALDSFDATRARSLGTTRVAPFASAWAFGLVVLIFGAEWFLRRLWGRR